MRGLAIRDMAERTGIAAGTIRMWEQRYGFPTPERDPSGYRRYSEEDVEALRRVAAHRERGLSLSAAIARVTEDAGPSDRPSLYAAVAGGDLAGRPQVLRKSTLVALSRAIEHELLAHAARPVLFGAFQQESFYRKVELRYRRLARTADAAVVFADFERFQRPSEGPVEVPIAPADALGNEWAVVVDAPGYAACLLAWEQPERDQPGGARDMDRRFEGIWTVDPHATRRAAHAAARLAARTDAGFAQELEELLRDRPLAMEEPSPALTALTNRVVAYVDAYEANGSG